MKAVVLFNDAVFARCARVCAVLLERATGVRPTLLESADPFRDKMRLTERVSEPFLFVDGDIAFRRDCSEVREWFRRTADGELVAARSTNQKVDAYSWSLLASDMARDEDRTVNTGLFVADPRHHAAMFRAALELYDQHDGERKHLMWDQGPVNVAIQSLGVPQHVLNPRYNHVASPGCIGTDDVAVHFAGGDGWSKLAHMESTFLAVMGRPFRSSEHRFDVERF